VNSSEHPPQEFVQVNNEKVNFVTNLIALGIYVDPVLNWDRQAEHAISKARKLTSTFKYFDEEQFLQIASANYYGTVFMPVQFGLKK